MPITLTMTYESTEHMLHDLAALVRLTTAPAVAAPVAEAAIEPLANTAATAEIVVTAPEMPETVVAFDKPRRGRPAKPRELTAEETAIMNQMPAAEAPPAVASPEDCIEAVKSLVSRTGDILAPGHVLGGFGVKKTRELTDEQRAPFVSACAAYVAEGAGAKAQ